MKSVFVDIYIDASILIAVLDIILAVKSIQKKIRPGVFWDMHAWGQLLWISAT